MILLAIGFLCVIASLFLMKHELTQEAEPESNPEEYPEEEPESKLTKKPDNVQKESATASASDTTGENE